MADVRVEKRGCLSCGSFQMCKLFRDIRLPLANCEGITLNLYKDGRTPGIFVDIFEAIGNACLEYQPRTIEEVNDEEV